MTEVARVLLTGPPGVGKTTVTVRTAALLADRGAFLAGFTTSEIRRGGRRTGFTIKGMGGLERLLAVRGGPGPRVGAYGVDVAAFEEVALLEIENGLELDATLIVDEIGKMELLSEAFREIVPRVFSASRVLATVHAHRDPLTDDLKARTDVQVIGVNAANRGDLPAEVAELITAGDRAGWPASS